MISYAQNYEDVILARVFQNLEHGIYVDLGASDSTLDSVTRHFYDSGWSGINVEPNPENFQTLARDRPRDLNLNVGIGAENSTQTFYSIFGNGLSTFDSALGEKYLQEFPGSKVIQVQMLGVQNLISKIKSRTKDVHFLKVDIEGHEEEVLKAWNFEELTPWVVVVEATKPRTQIPTHHLWEEYLISAGYKLKYQDGLNRFYLHTDHPDLEQHFAFPPNVFDGFMKNSEYLVNLESSELRLQLTHLSQELFDIKASLSWKLTAPLRRLWGIVKLPHRKK